MAAAFSTFFENDYARQRWIVALLVALLLAFGFAPRNDRALFLPSGLTPTGFAAITPPPPQTINLIDFSPAGPRRFRFAPSPRFRAIASPPSNLVPSTTPDSPVLDDQTPGALSPQSGSFTPAAFDSPGGPFAFGNPFNPAAPGGFFPTAGTPTIPTDPDTPVTPALPEPGTWLLMIAGFFFVGSVLRRTRAADRVAPAL